MRILLKNKLKDLFTLEPFFKIYYFDYFKVIIFYIIRNII